MNTHVEQGATVRPDGSSLLGRLGALIGARFKAWRTQQNERAELEALEALGPEMLNDIGVTIVKAGKPPKSIAVCNPHAIAMGALAHAQAKERDEF